MKTILLLALVALSVHAETNFFPVLPAGDRVYTNARIVSTTAAYAVIHYEGGAAQVALSNLSPRLQQQYNYDPEKAAREFAAQAAGRKQSADAWQARLDDFQRLETWRGEPYSARVSSVGKQWGTWTESTIVLSNRTYKVLLARVPGHIKDYLGRRAAVENDVPNLEAYVDKETRRIDRLEQYWLSRSDYYYYTHRGHVYWDYDYQRRAALNRLGRDRNALEDTKRRLADLQQEAKTLMENQESLSTCIVRQTTKTYAGLQIWECN